MGQLCGFPSIIKDDLPEDRRQGKYLYSSLDGTQGQNKGKSTEKGQSSSPSTAVVNQQAAQQSYPSTGTGSVNQQQLPYPHAASSSVPTWSTGSTSLIPAVPPPPPQQVPLQTNPNKSAAAYDTAANGASDTDEPSPTRSVPLSGGVVLSGKDGEWDAQQFQVQLQEARAAGDKHMEKRILKQVAENNYVLRKNWKVPRTNFVTYERCKSTRVTGRGKDPLVRFSNLSTADAVLLLAKDRQKRICALNFANGETVGGGYKHGATAQEEDLCRRIPALYTSLWNAQKNGLYPFGPCTCASLANPAKYSDVLHTGNLVVGRTGEAQGYALLKPVEQARLSLVTAAAPNINFAKEVYDLELMYKTVTAIFVAPLIEEPHTNTLVLGAWGCGAFGCSPQDVSGLFTRAYSDNLWRLYDEIHFAIPAGNNADVFREALKSKGIRISG